jgi:hypothetical protein
VLGEFDYSLNDPSRVSGRYGEAPWSNDAKLAWIDNPAEPSGQYPSMRIARNRGADWTYKASPSVVINIRGGLARYEGYPKTPMEQDTIRRNSGCLQSHSNAPAFLFLETAKRITMPPFRSPLLAGRFVRPSTLRINAGDFAITTSE